MSKTKTDKLQQQKNVAGLGCVPLSPLGACLRGFARCCCGADSSSRCRCLAAMRGQLAVRPADLRKLLLEYTLGKLFDLFIRTFPFEKQYCCIAYLFFSIMNLNSQKLEKLILHLYKIMLSIGKYYL